MTRRESFTTSGTARLDVDVPAGNVEVVARPVDAITVALDGSGDDRWEIVQVGDTVSVRNPSRWRTRSIRLVVEVPQRTEITARSASADVVVSGDCGAVRIHTASGDVRVAEATHLDVRSASGDIRVGRVGTDTSASTVSGDLEVTTAAGRLSAVTASGDVVVERLGGDADIGTASGDIRISRFDGDHAMIKAISGDVSIGLPGGIRVEPDLSTLSGRTTLPSPGAPSDPGGPRRTVRLRVQSVSGDIRISRA